MLAQALASRLNRAGIHYGWAIVGIIFLTALATSGSLGVPSVLIAPLAAEFGWDAEQISSALALRILIYGLMAPFTAALVDKYGFQRVIVTALCLIEAGLLLSLTMSRLWQLVALWGVTIGLGTGMTAMIMGALVATRWFTARRGLVAGMLTASTATGQLVFVPFAAWLSQTYGWRFAVAPQIVLLGVVGVLVLLFVVDRPQDVGLRPYGETEDAPVQPPPTAAFSRAFDVLRKVSGNGAFWILAASFFVCGLSTNGLIQTHFISLCEENGMPAVTAASLLAMIGVCDFFGTILSGWLSDRFDNRALLCVYYGLRGLSLIYLPASTFTVAGLSLFSLFYGLDWVATVPPTVKLSAANFGRERAGVAYGWIFASHMLGGALAAYGAGYSRTTFHSYLPAIYGAGAACLVAAALVWLIGRSPSSRTLAAAAA